jgi:hypothetical protein
VVILAIHGDFPAGTDAVPRLVPDDGVRELPTKPCQYLDTAIVLLYNSDTRQSSTSLCAIAQERRGFREATMSQQIVDHILETQRQFGANVPSELNALTDAVESCRDILDWPDDWDGEGSLAYAETTWNRMAALLLDNAARLWHDCQVKIATPVVYNGPQGSIDIYWALSDRKLLINVPPVPEEPISFYGHIANTSNEIKGALNDADTRLWLMLMMWLMN